MKLSLTPLVMAIMTIVHAPLSEGQAVSRSSREGTDSAIQTPIQSAKEIDLDEKTASEWGLRSEEWSRYRQLMRGPLGVYSPNLDPLTALGIEARSEEERRRYAELQVRAEGRRVQKLLAYQRAYDAAWRRLYPSLEPIASDSTSLPPSRSQLQGVGSQTAGRLAVFVKENCAMCDQRVRELQSSGRPFDVYVIGSLGDDAVIRRWAAGAGIDPQKVRARLITLNHDAGRWLSIGGQGDLPALIRQANGQWQRE
jgi:integrating conjugative element protein (TIGR03759 family)